MPARALCQLLTTRRLLGLRTEVWYAGHCRSQLREKQDIRKREEERGLGQRPVADVSADGDPYHCCGEHVIGEEEREREDLDHGAALR